MVDVNEEGTEAVAATAVMYAQVRRPAMRPPKPVIPVFRAHHPFLFAIRNRASRETLFIGRVAGTKFKEATVLPGGKTSTQTGFPRSWGIGATPP